MLDLGLEEVVGGREPPDLSARVLRAAAGRRGDAPRERSPAPHPGGPRRWHRRVLAGAAAAAVLIAFLLIRRDPGGSPEPGPSEPVPVDAPIARADRPLAPLDGSGRLEPALTDLAPGRWVAHLGDGAVRVELRDGGSLRFESPAALAVDDDAGPPQIRILEGAVQIDAAGVRLAAHLGASDRVEIPPGSRAVVERRPIEMYRPLAEIAPDEFLVDAGLDADWWVRAKRGEVLVHTGGEPIPVGEGDELARWLGAPPRRRAALSPEEERLLEIELESLAVELPPLPEDDPAREDAEIAADLAADRMRGLLADRSAAWDHARPRLVGMLDDPDRLDRRRAARLLLRDPHPGTLAQLRKSYETMEMASEPDLLMEMASRGLEWALRPLRAWAGARSPELSAQIYTAVYLALRGDRVGIHALWKAVDGGHEAFLRDPNAYFAAAAGLAMLGKTEPWENGLVHLRHELRRPVPREGSEPPHRRVLRARYFHRALDGAESIELTDMDEPVVEFIDEEEERYPDTDSLLALVERMSLR